MTRPLFSALLTEPELRRFAQELAFALRTGDTIALHGDLGAGKTTLARACILACVEGVDEIPSPTFTLVQAYSGSRFAISHFDLYRLSAPEEIYELGLDNALATGVALIEWPERAGDLLPQERIDIGLEDSGDEATRRISVPATTPQLEARLARLADIHAFLQSADAGAGDVAMAYLQGDASPRRYARLTWPNGHRAILMDSPAQPDGPPVRDGLPYSRIAHLAEDVRAFVAVDAALRMRGLSAPEIYASDLQRGLLLIEDLGDAVFGREIAMNRPQRDLWRRGVDVLVALASAPPAERLPLPDGTNYALPPMDQRALQIEAELLTDWYWPAFHGAPVPAAQRDKFIALWTPLFAHLRTVPQGWALRDYHSPNLIALDDRVPPRDVGIIDFQDALLGPTAYDLVSLLQDARLDVPADIESDLLAHYIARVSDADRSFDAAAFRFAYAILGAQRNTKILGIFARLAKRDGKRQYLAHMPRIWGYLERNLSHEALRPLRAWYDEHFPLDMRRRALAI